MVLVRAAAWSRRPSSTVATIPQCASQIRQKVTFSSTMLRRYSALGWPSSQARLRRPRRASRGARRRRADCPSAASLSRCAPRRDGGGRAQERRARRPRRRRAARRPLRAPASSAASSMPLAVGAVGEVLVELGRRILDHAGRGRDTVRRGRAPAGRAAPSRYAMRSTDDEDAALAEDRVAGEAHVAVRRRRRGRAAWPGEADDLERAHPLLAPVITGDLADAPRGAARRPRRGRRGSASARSSPHRPARRPRPRPPRRAPAARGPGRRRSTGRARQRRCSSRSSVSGPGLSARRRATSSRHAPS